MTARTARVLMAMVIPGQIVFIVVIYLLDAGHTSITPIFSVGYLTAAVIQVRYICRDITAAVIQMRYTRIYLTAAVIQAAVM